MRTLHQVMMGVTLVALLAVSVAFIQPLAVAAVPQHGQVGQHGDAGGAGRELGTPEEMFAMFSTHLELTDEQRHAVAEPFAEGFAAMQELHRLHEVIAAELTEEQQETFTGMIHEMMAGPPSGHGH